MANKFKQFAKTTAQGAKGFGMEMLKKSKLVLTMLWALLFSLIYITWYLTKPKGRVYISVFINLLIRGYSLSLLPYVMAQARHESNDFKSDLFKRAKNIFGMKIASQRKQRGTKSGSSNGYAIYKSCFWSVYDFFERIQQFDKTNDLFKKGESSLDIGYKSEAGMSVSSYRCFVYALAFKSTRYFEDKVNTYASRIYHWKNQKSKSDNIEASFMLGSSIISLTAFGIFLYSKLKKK